MRLNVWQLWKKLVETLANGVEFQFLYLSPPPPPPAPLPHLILFRFFFFSFFLSFILSFFLFCSFLLSTFLFFLISFFYCLFFFLSFLSFLLSFIVFVFFLALPSNVFWAESRRGSLRFVCWLVNCLTSQKQASVSQGRVCTDNFTCCHTEIEDADQTFFLT